jgi:hypothetical protein
MTSCLSPFRWRDFPRPSIFATDSTFTTGARMGKTLSHTSSEAVSRHIERTGRSPGTLMGISPNADRQAEEQRPYRRKR